MIIAIGVNLYSLRKSNVVELGKKIETLRTQQGMSQGDLAKRVKTSQNTIHKIETGETKRSGYIAAIAGALGCTTEELLSNNQISQKPVESPLQARLIRKIMDADQKDLAEIEETMDAILKISGIKKRASGK